MKKHDITYEFHDFYTPYPTQNQRMYSSTLCIWMTIVNSCHSNLNVLLVIGEKRSDDTHFPYFKIVKFNTGKSIATLSIDNPNNIIWGSIDKISKREFGRIREFITSNKKILLEYYRRCNDDDYDAITEFYNKLKRVTPNKFTPTHSYNVVTELYNKLKKV